MNSKLLLGLILVGFATTSSAQESPELEDQKTKTDATTQVPESAAAPETPATVNVSKVVLDDKIESRLRSILKSTEWFQNEEVNVDSGVVFLTGETSLEKYRTWASDLAGKTEDVVAVVNRITVANPPWFDAAPALQTMRALMQSVVRGLPLTAISLLLLGATWIVARLGQHAADATILRRVQTPLLREVARKVLFVPMMLLGLFLVLRMTGLTQLAMTVLGGTGLIGLVIGIAFRDIAENFLASILLSMHNPFRYGDLIEVGGHTGHVRRVSTRGKLLMTEDGNHIQIPNSDIFKGTIINYTANPNRRFSFAIGIGYDSAITAAQEAAIDILRKHPAILKDPEPQILVDELESSSIKLIIRAWVDTSNHSWAKVRSSVMRLVLQRFHDLGISMPDEQREIVFPQDVPVRILRKEHVEDEKPTVAKGSQPAEALMNEAEDNLRGDAQKLQEQAEKSRDPDNGQVDLLSTPPKIRKS